MSFDEFWNECRDRVLEPCLDDSRAKRLVEAGVEFGWNAYEKLNNVLELKKKLERYERGDFTKDEIHNFCHNLEKTVSLCEFQEGCRLYQEKLFGIKIDKKP